jgi:hypothetical protein
MENMTWDEIEQETGIKQNTIQKRIAGGRPWDSGELTPKRMQSLMNRWR